MTDPDALVLRRLEVIPEIANDDEVAAVSVVFPLNVFVPENTLLVVVPNAVEMVFADRVSGYVNESGDSYEPVKLSVFPDHPRFVPAVIRVEGVS